jgi:hypothetical protein
MNSPSISLLISALAGAFGALVFRAALKLGGKIWAARVPLAIYDCLADGEDPGVYRHGWGKPAPDKHAWSYTPHQIPRKEGKLHEHTLFGPYVNDFGHPGHFEVRFRISGKGLSHAADPIIVLDVIQAPFDLQRDHLVLGQKIIRSRELSEEYRDFSVKCYTVGTGVYEYRASVVAELFRAQQEAGSGPEILFDRVAVHSRVPIWEII